MEDPQERRRPAILTHLKGLSPFSLIPLVVGAPFLLIGLSEVNRVVQLERTWVSTRGTVVDNMVVAFATGASYAPVVDFRTLEGETVRFADGVGTTPPPPSPPTRSSTSAASRPPTQGSTRWCMSCMD